MRIKEPNQFVVTLTQMLGTLKYRATICENMEFQNFSSVFIILNYQYELSSSVQAGPKWLFRSDFPSSLESAEIWHVYYFCVKKCPCVFFSRMQKTVDKIASNSTPLPPPPPPLCPSPKKPRISIFEGQNTVYVSFMLLEGDWGGGGGGGGGELSRMCLKPCFPACGQKNRHIF